MSLAFRLVYAGVAWLAFSHLQGYSLDAVTFAVLVGVVVLGIYILDGLFWVSRELVVAAKGRIA